MRAGRSQTRPLAGPVVHAEGPSPRANLTLAACVSLCAYAKIYFGGMGGVAVRCSKVGATDPFVRSAKILPYNKGKEAMQDKQVGPNPSGLCMCGCSRKTKIRSPVSDRVTARRHDPNVLVRAIQKVRPISSEVSRARAKLAECVTSVGSSSSSSHQHGKRLSCLPR